MRSYVGIIQNGTEPEVFVNKGDGNLKPLPRAYHLRNHSPDGFAWGYAGSGPAQLSIAILSDHFRDDKTKIEPWPDKARTSGDLRACQLYQKFKAAIIQHLDKDTEFTLTSEQVQQWVDANG